MANEGSNVNECLQAVENIKNEINGAKSTLLYRETCVVNREYLLTQLKFLKDNLPDTISRASTIVREENTILKNAATSRDEMINEATRQANELVNNAGAQASQIMERAAAEANTWMEQAKMMANQHVEAAKAQAMQILDDAQKRANQMVEEETIMRRARAQSEELLEKSRSEAANCRQKALEFIDGQLSDLDRNLSDLLNRVRLERGDVQEKSHQS